MKHLTKGYSAAVGLVVVIFVVLVGALGYTYVLNYKAQVATTPNQGKSIAAQTVEVPNVASPADLDKAIDVLDAAAVDELSATDLQALQNEMNSL